MLEARWRVVCGQPLCAIDVDSRWGFG